MQIRRMLPRPSPAMVVACVALAVALGGTSFATVSTLIPQRSVGTVQLQDNAVTSRKVRNFSLRLWDFKRGTLVRGPRGLRGFPGPQGPAGVQGPAGAQGPAGVIGDLTMHANSVTVPGNVAGNGLYVTKVSEVTCSSAEKAITGGSSWSDDSDDHELITVYSRPVIENGRPVGWRARGGTDLAEDRVFSVQVLCAKR
jgi:hypothetical protein